jgi:DNA-binding CsgD family transcriptional regulator
MSVVDQIYEAAFVPELWPEVLGNIAQLSQSYSGALLIIDPKRPPLFAATPNIVDTLAEFAKTPHWYVNAPAHRLRTLKYPGFMERAEFFRDDERTLENPYHANMEKIRADWQVGSVVDMPDGEMALFTFERQRGLPDFSPTDLALLDGFRPHLARASMMASRLQLDRAQASVAAMNAVGVPACVVTALGSVVSANALFKSLSDILRPAAFGKLSARDRQADKLLQAALSAQEHSAPADVRSFPMRRHDGENPIVVHVIPLARSASDIFERGSAMVTVTGYSVTGNLPSDTVLRGLFDLSVAEAGIASDLSAGQTVKQIAALRALSTATVRTHLAQIFRKTGTSQQGQLIALLKGIRGLAT